MRTIAKYTILLLGIGIALYSCKKEDLIEGCTDAACPNYNADASFDDGSCDCINQLEEITVANIVADTGGTGIYTYFSLRENKIIPQEDSATTKWDLGFKGTSIITNSGTSGPGKGGAIVMDGIFEEFKKAPTAAYNVDGNPGLAIPTGSGNGWYLYTSTNEPKHAILPLAGKIIMVKTADEKYAKLEIQSYYKGNPNTATSAFSNLNTRPSGRHYNFRYIYQPDGTINF